MPELNLHQIDQITQDVQLQEIGFSHLFHDLVDHICCDIEYEMQQGFSYDEAYRNVKAKIGFRGLKKIQEETLYAVDTKYRNMKNLIKISGVAGTVMLSFAAIFKISHWPMAGVLITLGALCLSFLFLPSALIVLWKETKNQKKLLLFISAFIAGVAFISGMVFKIQHWPGANIAILIGLITGAVLFVPLLLVQLFSDQEKKHKRFLYVLGAVSAFIYAAGVWFRIFHWPLAVVMITLGSFILFFVAYPWFTRIQWENDTNISARFIFLTIGPLLFIMPVALTNLNLERTYDTGFYISLKKQAEMIKLQGDANTRFLTLYRDSVSSERIVIINNAASELISSINLLQQNLAAIGSDEKKANATFTELKGSYAFDPASDRFPENLFVSNPVNMMLLPGWRERALLENEIEKYKQTLIQQFGAEWIKKYDPLLNTSEYLPGSKSQGTDLFLLPNIYSLSLLESSVLITESAALKQIASKK